MCGLIPNLKCEQCKDVDYVWICVHKMCDVDPYDSACLDMANTGIDMCIKCSHIRKQYFNKDVKETDRVAGIKECSNKS